MTIYTLLWQWKNTGKKNHAAYRYRYGLHNVLGIKGCHIVSLVSTACILVCMPDPGRARNEMMDGVLEDLLPNFDGSHTSQKVGIGPCFPLCSIHSTFNSTSGRSNQTLLLWSHAVRVDEDYLSEIYKASLTKTSSVKKCIFLSALISPFQIFELPVPDTDAPPYHQRGGLSWILIMSRLVRVLVACSVLVFS